MNQPNIILCTKICEECGFSKEGTTDTLYAEVFDMFDTGTIFPCHMYLKSKTGNESYGSESLDTIPVCRGYVAYTFLHRPAIQPLPYVWNHLFSLLNHSDLANIYTPDELIQAHKGLRGRVYLGNSA